MRASVSILVMLVTASMPRIASGAPTRQACLDAYEEAQVSMRRGRLLHARQPLGTCLETSCPPTLHADCADWLKEVDARTPSVVVESVQDGVSIRDVTLLVDGVVRPEGIDGLAFDIDPGNHVFRIEPREAAPLVIETVVREGEKRRPVRFVLPSRLPPAPVPTAERSPEAAPPKISRETRPVPWPVYATAGVGLLAASGFAVFAILGTSSKGDLEVCKPGCSNEQIVDVRSRFIVADIFLGVTILALGAATVHYLTRPTVTRSSATRDHRHVPPAFPVRF